jgi:hypothetical protein
MGCDVRHIKKYFSKTDDLLSFRPINVKIFGMGKKTNLGFAVLIFSLNCMASGELRTVGGRSAGMGFTSASVSDLWSAVNNPAGLARLESPSCGIYYENRFLVNELSLKAGVATLPLKAGTFAIAISRFGFLLYNETAAGLSYARKFGKAFSAGIRLDYLRVHLGEDLGNKNLVTFDIGMQYLVNHRLTLGIHVYNPLPAKLASWQDERISTVIRLGLCEKFSANFLMTLEIEKDLQHNILFKTGMEYHFVKPIFIRLGLVTYPTILTSGLGFEWGHLAFDLGTNYHRVLGYSPEGSVSYRFK